MYRKQIATLQENPYSLIPRDLPNRVQIQLNKKYSYNEKFSFAFYSDAEEQGYMDIRVTPTSIRLENLFLNAHRGRIPSLMHQGIAKKILQHLYATATYLEKEKLQIIDTSNYLFMKTIAKLFPQAWLSSYAQENSIPVHFADVSWLHKAEYLEIIAHTPYPSSAAFSYNGHAFIHRNGDPSIRLRIEKQSPRISYRKKPKQACYPIVKLHGLRLNIDIPVQK